VFDIYSTESILRQQQHRVKQKLTLFNSSSSPGLQHRANHPLPEVSSRYIRDVVQPYLSRAAQNSKRRRENDVNELLLMKVDWSSDLKLACYDLQNIRPASDGEVIHETAQVLEDILQTVCGVKPTYPF
jgi:hypothetical protein